MTTLNIEKLAEPTAWPHPVVALRLIETHTAWVFLTGDYAYKIKKPVNFGFLDFSTLKRRQHCCEEELRLNRRLAPDLYLEVVPVTGSTQAPQTGGEGEPIDFAVKMRQFDTDLAFDHMAQRDAITTDHVDAMARVLADFHGSADIAPPEGEFGTLAAARYPVMENFEQIAPHLPQQAPEAMARFAALEQWSDDACRALEPGFAARLAAGFVRECHGDLHLRNIVLWRDQVLPFDCLEFNPSLRWIDVMSELGFLLMDLDDHGLAPLSRRLLNAYLEYTGDFGGLALLRFYQAYRAMVRVKVESLRLAQLPELDPVMVEELRNYLALAESYTRPGKPRLMIAHGLSGSGKTYVSQRLLEATDLVRLRSDVERKRLAGLGPLQDSGSARDAGIYSLEANTRTYDQLLAQAAQLLEAGWPVLVDAAFLKREERDAFRDLAERSRVDFTILHCEAELTVQRERIVARRGDASEADVVVLDLQIERQEALDSDELAYTLHVDTTHSPDLGPALDWLGA